MLGALEIARKVFATRSIVCWPLTATMQLSGIICDHGHVACAGQRGQYMSLVRMTATLPSSAWQCLDHPQLLIVIVSGFGSGAATFLLKGAISAGLAHEG